MPMFAASQVNKNSMVYIVIYVLNFFFALKGWDFSAHCDDDDVDKDKIIL